MAKLCVTYLTFPCFGPLVSDLHIESHTNKGDYSFQEYATCNWIYHVKSSIDFLADSFANRDEAFKASYNLLRKLHALNCASGHSTPDVVDFVEHRSLLKTELEELDKIYRTESIFSKDPSNGM
jgi:hypothetical protein